MKIIHFGTFDVENYGDLLFPLVLEKRLADLGAEIIHASPRGGGPVWRDCVSSVSIETVLDQPRGISGVIIGGGNIVHASPTTLESYSRGGISGVIAYPSLWLGAAHLAWRNQASLAWNGPSVAQPFSSSAARLARWTAAQTHYLAVRDPSSELWLREAGVTTGIQVVPDTALEVSRLWARREIEAAYVAAFASRGREVPAKTLAVHLNARFTGQDLDSLAQRLDRIVQKLNATAILIATGPCHADDELQRVVGRKMTTRPLIVDRPESLREIAACIAHSEAYLGSSLHGIITACSYGKRGMMIMPKANAPVARVTGFLNLFNLSRWLVETWTAAEELVPELFQSAESEWRWPMERGMPLLETHWHRLREALASTRTQSRRGKSAARPSSISTELHEMGVLRNPSSLIFWPILTEQAGKYITALRTAEEIGKNLQETGIALDALKERSQQELTLSEAKRREAEMARGQLEETLQRLNAELKEREDLVQELQRQSEEKSSQVKQLAIQVEQRDRVVQQMEHTLAQTSGALERSNELCQTMREQAARFTEMLPQLEQIARSPYLEMLRRIRDVARNLLPKQATLLVVSKGDEELLKLDCDKVWHFPRANNGAYAGHHPADGQEAVAHLTALRGEGAEFLLFPSTSFWWLDYYHEFRTHLDACFQRCWLDDSCIVYRLTRPVPTQRAANANGTKDGEKEPLEPAHTNGKHAKPELLPNQAASNQTRYRQTVAEIRRLVKRLIPSDSTIAVVSKGDDDLLDLGGRRAWHFPRLPEGTYAGHHPVDSRWAIDNIEKLRADGAEFLLLPQTSFWWLDFYRELGTHLQTNYREVWSDPSCKIYLLLPAAPNARFEQLATRFAAAPAERALSAIDEAKPAAHHSTTGTQNGPASANAVEDFGPAARPLVRHLVTVAIPIFNAYDEVVRCLGSVIRHGRHPYQLLLIDDSSSDRRIWPMLQAWARLYPQIRVLRNEQNLGFTGTVNVACRAVPGDIILLNSDTVVTRDWVEKLSACAATANNIGTVTAVSNSAGAFSVPVNHRDNPVPDHLSIDEVAAVVENTSERTWPRTPTGNGFCLYITRKVLNEIGYFDEKNFPKGYGEENDFCMRAVAKGFVNVIDDSTFVYHQGTASFLNQKSNLAQEHLEVLARLHPAYNQNIQDWLRNDPLDPFRATLSQRLAKQPTKRNKARRQAAEQPCLLFLVHDGAGGTIHMVEDLAQALASQVRCLILKTGLRHWTLMEFQSSRCFASRRYNFTQLWEGGGPMCVERQGVLRDVCDLFEVDLVHAHHLLGNGPDALELFHSRAIPVVLSFHDFYPVCPTVTLLDETWSFCAGNCTATAGDCSIPESWFVNGLPPLKHRYIHRHRERMERALKCCARFITPSKFMLTILADKFPFLEGIGTRVIEHGRDLARIEVAAAPIGDAPAKVACMGHFNEAKGIGLLSRIMELNVKAGRPFEFHFFGAKAPNFKPELNGGIDHGPYERDRLPELLQELKPSFSLIASVCPETFCYTLSESWAAGLPVFASNLGALAERISSTGAGWLLDPKSPEQWFSGMLQVLDSQGEYERKLKQVLALDLKTVAGMAADYLQVYQEVCPQAFIPTAANRPFSPVNGIAA